ncbi:MAG: response regulator transcription factor [Actinomycetota bacterium]|nr:response regulator transcription factor [Actinomycetota bacterium]
MIRVFILAQVRLYREGLAENLGRQEHVEVVGTAGDCDVSLDAIPWEGMNIALLDMSMPNSCDAVHHILDSAPAIKVVALAVAEVEDDLIAYAEAGVSGYVMRDDSLSQLLAALESVNRGEMVCSPRTAATLMRRVTTLAASRQNGVAARLTAREREILELIDEGLSNKQIARCLYIELATVKNHVHNILEKLQVHRRSEAAARLRSGTDSPEARRTAS